MQPTPPAPVRAQRGFSLSEMLVATAIFLLVILAAYQVFQRGQESYRLGQNTSEAVQAARVGFDQMSDDIRLAGFEFDVDGEKESYPNQADEPIEFMHRRAIVLRANFDFDKEMRGRESGLEFDAETDQITCCPIVTTGNDEIIGYALGKPSGTQPPGTITFKADTTGTVSTLDTVVRDAFVNKTTGAITGEETKTIANVELRNTNDAAYAPPYTLYRFYFDDAGAVVRQPFIDNVYSIEFTYYDGSGNVILDGATPLTQADWGDDNGFDKQAGRLTRWNVRRVKVEVRTMTPETDLRLKRVSGSTGVPNFQGRRIFTLQAEVFPPNLGRRGARDRDINPPEPPRNVEICSGQCDMVRVSWDPGPPEDKVVDHIVTLCWGPCDNFGPSNAAASFIWIANYDLTRQKEYATFTREDDPDILPGTELWAQVIARNAAGTTSECPVTDCTTCCRTQAGAIVGERSRPDTFPSARGSGYDASDANFPDARPNNVGGQLIVTNSALDAFPSSLAPILYMDSPRFALNKAPSAGTAPNDWTTKRLGGEVVAAMSCHTTESTPSDPTDDPAWRTPFDALRRDPERGNTYIWRVRGSAPGGSSELGGGSAPRNFVPTGANLYDWRHMPLSAGNPTFVDGSSYTFASTAWGDRYDGYGENFIKVAGVPAQPIRATTPCEVYYYRFRAASICWSDDKELTTPVTPPNGVHDSASPTIRAWDVFSTAGTSEYRRLIKSLTPFYPPMLNEGDTTGTRDRADQTVHDSDDYTTAASVDTYALPAYSLPQRVVDAMGVITGWVKPERPNELYLTRTGDSGTTFLTGAGDPALYDARMVFNAARRTAPATGEGDPQMAGFRTYRLYRKAASSATPGVSEFDFDSANPTLVAEFDTKSDGNNDGQPDDDLRRYTMDGSGLVPQPGVLNALNDLGSDWADTSPDSTCSQEASARGNASCIPFIYWLKTAQCTKFDDGIDTSAAELSAASPGFQFPCTLHYDVQEIRVTPSAAATPPSTVQYEPSMLDASGDLDCSSIQSARLIAYRQSTGDYLGASDWRAYNPSNNCGQATLPNPAVNEAVRGFTGAVRFVVEISTNGVSTASNGCRLRSDYGPVDIGVKGIPVSCSAARSCGTQSSPAIFGAVDESNIELANNDTKLIIHLPKLTSCGSSFDLTGLEIKLEKTSGSDDDIPNFTSGAITGGLQTSRTLPAFGTDACDLNVAGDLDQGEDDTGEADLDGSDGAMVLRWRDSFCVKTPATNDDPCACEWDYPTVLGTASELTIELQFASTLCDVRVTQLNFRVMLEDLADSDGDSKFFEELSCTQRPRRPADAGNPNNIDATLCPDTTPQDPPLGPAGSDPDLPIGCTLEGQGRGPALSPEVACGACLTVNCQPCQCPLNENDADIQQDLDPIVTLVDDPDHPFGLPYTLLKVEYTQTTNEGCNDDPSGASCPFRITDIELRIECTVDRDCTGGEPLGKLTDDGIAEAKLIHADLSQVSLPEPTTRDSNDPSFGFYKWTGLSLDLVDGETFRFEFRFDDSIDRGQLATMKVRFSRPFQAECTAAGDPGGTLGPLCSLPGSPIYLSP